MAGAHDVGSGEGVVLQVDRAPQLVGPEVSGSGRPLVLEVAAPLHPANQRLWTPSASRFAS